MFVELAVTVLATSDYMGYIFPGIALCIVGDESNCGCVVGRFRDGS